MTNPTVGNQLAITCICIQSAEIFQRFLLTDSGDTNVKLYVQSTPDNSNLFHLEGLSYRKSTVHAVNKVFFIFCYSCY